MEAALRSAGHDARLLRSHLQHALGQGGELLSERTARTATACLLSQGETHCDLDTETALQQSRLTRPTPPSCANGPSLLKRDPLTGTAMDVERVCEEPHAPVSGDGGTALPSSLGEGPAAAAPAGTGSPQNVLGLGKESQRVHNSDEDNNRTRGDAVGGGGHEEAANDIKVGGSSDDANENNVAVVDRGRLIALLAAEARINAMANHLGSAETTTYLRSLLLVARPSSSGGPSSPPPRPSGSWNLRNNGSQQQQQPRQFEAELSASPAMVMRQLPTAEGLVEEVSAVRPPTAVTVGKFPRLSGDSSSADTTRRRDGGPALQGNQHRSQSADNLFSSAADQAGSSWRGPGIAEAAAVSGGMLGGGGDSGTQLRYNNQGRKKRSRGGEETNQSREGGGGGALENEEELCGLSRSASFAMGQRHHMTAPMASTNEGGPSHFSLPKLNASRLSW